MIAFSMLLATTFAYASEEVSVARTYSPVTLDYGHFQLQDGAQQESLTSRQDNVSIVNLNQYLNSQGDIKMYEINTETKYINNSNLVDDKFAVNSFGLFGGGNSENLNLYTLDTQNHYQLIFKTDTNNQNINNNRYAFLTRTVAALSVVTCMFLNYLDQ